jgi:hypothetical protein
MLAAMLASSPEYFQTRGGGTNDGFLNAVYQDSFKRAIDGSGQATFSQALTAGLSRAQVVTTLFTSDEYRQTLVQNAYQQFLGRATDPGGLATWTNFLKQGARDEVTLAGIVGDTSGSEYFNQNSM